MKKEADYYRGLKYNVVVRKHKERFFLVILELGLLVDGENLSDAYADLERRKDEYLAKMVEIGSSESIREPVPLVMRKRIVQDLIIFVIKTAIVLFMTALVVHATLSSIHAFVTKPMADVRKR